MPFKTKIFQIIINNINFKLYFFNYEGFGDIGGNKLGL